MSSTPNNRFYRDADRAILGGVCAGIAGYLGFNLRVTRILAIIAFLMAMPVAVIAYLAVVFVFPASSSRHYDVATERMRKKRNRKATGVGGAAFEEPNRAELISRRCRDIDERLVRLEKLVTSRRFQLEQELRRL